MSFLSSISSHQKKMPPSLQFLIKAIQISDLKMIDEAIDQCDYEQKYRGMKPSKEHRKDVINSLMQSKKEVFFHMLKPRNQFDILNMVKEYYLGNQIWTIDGRNNQEEINHFYSLLENDAIQAGNKELLKHFKFTRALYNVNQSISEKANDILGVKGYQGIMPFHDPTSTFAKTEERIIQDASFSSYMSIMIGLERKLGLYTENPSLIIEKNSSNLNEFISMMKFLRNYGLEETRLAIASHDGYFNAINGNTEKGDSPVLSWLDEAEFTKAYLWTLGLIGIHSAAGVIYTSEVYDTIDNVAKIPEELERVSEYIQQKYEDVSEISNLLAEKISQIQQEVSDLVDLNYPDLTIDNSYSGNELSEENIQETGIDVEEQLGQIESISEIEELGMKILEATIDVPVEMIDQTLSVFS